MEERFSIPVADTGALVLRATGEPIRYRNTIPAIRGSFWGLDIRPDSLHLAGIRFRTTSSPDSGYHAVVRRIGFGKNPEDARRRATRISYPLPAPPADSHAGTFTLPAGFGIARPDAYRGQSVAVEIQVPKDRKIRFDPSLRDILPLHDPAEHDYGYNRHRKQWVFTYRNQITPESNRDYVLDRNGNLTLKTPFADENSRSSGLWERRQRETRRDSLQAELDRLDLPEDE